MEVREMRRDMARMATGGFSIPPEYAESEDFDPQDFVVVRRPDPDDFSSFVEDVSYEIEQDDAPSSRLPVRASMPAHNGRNDRDDDDDAPRATIKDAERERMQKALHRCQGNRRQTDNALGISESKFDRKVQNS